MSPVLLSFLLFTVLLCLSYACWEADIDSFVGSYTWWEADIGNSDAREYKDIKEVIIHLHWFH